MNALWLLLPCAECCSINSVPLPFRSKSYIK